MNYVALELFLCHVIWGLNSADEEYLIFMGYDAMLNVNSYRRFERAC